MITKRKILYRSNIYFTPLKDPRTIDAQKLSEILNEEYKKAGINIDDIDTGAVIITGETARKENAALILELMAENAGKFVAAVAGPNFESIIACKGAGVVKASKQKGLTIINIDIGGGTSNYALVKNGEIISTSCVNIGGRLIIFNHDGTIKHYEKAAKIIADYLGISLETGKRLPQEHLKKIIYTMTKVIFNVYIKDKEIEGLTSQLLMTEKIDPALVPKDYWLSISGGVSELIYKDLDFNENKFQDIGILLARVLKSEINKRKIKMYIPEEKIRATVIGAGQYALEVSGSTTFISKKFPFPMKNVPIIYPLVNRNDFNKYKVEREIQKAFTKRDIVEGSSPIALYFKNPVGIVYDKIKEFTLGIELGLKKTTRNNIPFILLFDTDIGKSVGNILRRETGIITPFISIDELDIEGDFIDIGVPIHSNQVVPVVIKRLLFD